jgi:hypothetical protein
VKETYLVKLIRLKAVLRFEIGFTDLACVGESIYKTTELLAECENSDYVGMIYNYRW